MKKISVMLSLVLAALLVFAAAGFAADGFTKTIKVGIIGPGSGNYAWVKDYFTAGAGLAMEEINAQNGAASGGVKMEWIFEDDMGDPTQAVTSTIKLIEREKVDVLFGPFNSSNALANIGVVEDNAIPELVFGLNDKITEQGYQWIFRCAPSDGVTVTSVLDYATQEAGYTKIAFMTDTTDYGTSAYEVGEPYLQALNLEPMTNEKFNIPDKDFTAQLLKIKAAEPEVALLHGDEADIGLIAKQRLQLGMGNIPLIGGIPLTGVKFLENAGPEGSEGCIVSTNFLASRDDANTQAFVKNFTAKYGYAPEARCAAMYDAAYILAEALKNNGGDISKPAVRDSLRAIQGLNRVQGTFSYDEKGNGLRSVIKAIFRNGEMQYLAE